MRIVLGLNDNDARIGELELWARIMEQAIEDTAACFNKTLDADLEPFGTGALGSTAHEMADFWKQGAADTVTEQINAISGKEYTATYFLGIAMRRAGGIDKIKRKREIIKQQTPRFVLNHEWN